MPSPEGNGRAFALAIGLNMAFVIIEFAYGFIAHSTALMADAGHNLSDVLGLVLACLTQPTAVGDIASTLSLSSSLVSHHLRLLRAARIVKAERQGKQVFYAAADAHISSLLSTMFEHIAEPATGMDA